MACNVVDEHDIFSPISSSFFSYILYSDSKVSEVTRIVPLFRLYALLARRLFWRIVMRVAMLHHAVCQSAVDLVGDLCLFVLGLFDKDIFGIAYMHIRYMGG